MGSQLQSLPEEVLSQIFNHNSVCDKLINLQLVCKHFRRAVHSAAAWSHIREVQFSPGLESRLRLCTITDHRIFQIAVSGSGASFDFGDGIRSTDDAVDSVCDLLELPQKVETIGGLSNLEGWPEILNSCVRLLSKWSQNRLTTVDLSDIHVESEFFEAKRAAFLDELTKANEQRLLKFPSLPVLRLVLPHNMMYPVKIQKAMLASGCLVTNFEVRNFHHARGLLREEVLNGVQIEALTLTEDRRRLNDGDGVPQRVSVRLINLLSPGCLKSVEIYMADCESEQSQFATFLDSLQADKVALVSKFSLKIQRKSSLNLVTIQKLLCKMPNLIDFWYHAYYDLLSPGEDELGALVEMFVRRMQHLKLDTRLEVPRPCDEQYGGLLFSLKNNQHILKILTDRFCTEPGLTVHIRSHDGAEQCLCIEDTSINRTLELHLE